MKTQLEVADTHFRPIHEDNRSLPNDADLKSKFKKCKMDGFHIKFHEESKNEL